MCRCESARELPHQISDWWQSRRQYSHARRNTETLHGRKSIHEFLARRIGEMQVVKIKHKVHSVLCDGKSGAFRAEVVGPEGDALPFFGWVELENQKVSTYIIHPER